MASLIPGIHPYRGGRYRHPRIKHHLTAAAKNVGRHMEEETGEPTPRPIHRNLPTACDDRQRTPCKSWKNHRKTQWKPHWK